MVTGDACKPSRSIAFSLFNMPVDSLHRAVTNHSQLISLVAIHRTGNQTVAEFESRIIAILAILLNSSTARKLPTFQMRFRALSQRFRLVVLGGTRTHYPQIMSLLLYPNELPNIWLTERIRTFVHGVNLHCSNHSSHNQVGVGPFI